MHRIKEKGIIKIVEIHC